MAPVPKGLSARHRRYWRKPWLRRAAWSKGFRRELAKRAMLTPNFSLAEARSKDGAAVPRPLVKGARGHAFHLERIRHKLGDRPLPVLSWYRSPAHNRAVGGASQSKHMQAIATDHPKAWVAANGGQERLRRVAVAAGMNGVGTYPAGSMHFDSRGGPPVFWSSF